MHKGLNFQSLWCCFLYTRSLIFNLFVSNFMCPRPQIWNHLNDVSCHFGPHYQTKKIHKINLKWVNFGNAQFQILIIPPLCQTWELEEHNVIIIGNYWEHRRNKTLGHMVEKNLTHPPPASQSPRKENGATLSHLIGWRKF